MSKIKIAAIKKELPGRTCLKCGWVHFGVSREYANAEITRFNDFFKKLSKQKKEDYYGNKKSSLRTYLFCQCGNPYYNFRMSKKGDVPDGCTIGPILYEPEEDYNEKARAKLQAEREKRND